MQKPKRKNKSKEELLAELKNNVQFKEKLAFVREKFYPALTKATDNVESAINHLAIMNSFLMESFLGFMKEKKFSELKLQDKLSPLDPKYQENVDFLNLLNDKTVFEAKDLMEGLRAEIELFKRDYFMKMPMNDLPAKWLDEI